MPKTLHFHGWKFGENRAGSQLECAQFFTRDIAQMKGGGEGALSEQGSRRPQIDSASPRKSASSKCSSRSIRNIPSQATLCVLAIMEGNLSRDQFLTRVYVSCSLLALAILARARILLRRALRGRRRRRPRGGEGGLVGRGWPGEKEN